MRLRWIDYILSKKNGNPDYTINRNGECARYCFENLEIGTKSEENIIRTTDA